MMPLVVRVFVGLQTDVSRCSFRMHHGQLSVARVAWESIVKQGSE